MAKPKRKSKAQLAEKQNDQLVPSEEKIARLLGLLLVKDMQNNTDKVLPLRTAGFSVADVAKMLDMDENQVSVTVYQARKKRRTD